ncbi:MAG: DNA-binding protein [Halomonas sp.]|nr:DNA-binding protein [Halomonas sp.]TVP51279.1 MAG: DNA-binding protein [Halomonas sp.]
MARSGIQYSDVQHAIDTLLTRGDTPSVQRIRDVLGTGSFTTISEHFRQWRSEREKNRDVPPPKGMPEVVVALASELWREAQEVANQTLLHYREEADRQVEAAHLKVEASTQQAANAEQREGAIAEHLRHVEQRMEALNRELAASQTSESHWRQIAEESRKEASQLQQGQQQLASQLEENARAHEAELKQQQAVFEKRISQEEQRHEAAEGRLMAMLDAAQQTRAQEEKTYQKRLQQGEQRIEALSQETKAKQQAMHQLQVEISQREQQLNEAQRQNSDLVERHQALTEQLAEAQTALKQQAKAHAQREAEQEKELQEAWQEKLWQRMETLQQQLADLPISLANKESDSHQ